MAGKSLIACSLTFPAVLAEVLLEVDNILCDHDGILDVGLNPLQALDALLAGVPSTPKSVTDTHSLTDVDCSVHKVVVDNGIQHSNSVSGELLDTEVLLAFF